MVLKLIRKGSVTQKLLGFVVFILGFSLLTRPELVFAQNGFDDGDKRQELERQIEALEKEAGAIDKVIQDVRGEKRTLANELMTLRSEIKKKALEIKRLSLAVKKTTLEVNKKELEIEILEGKIHSAKGSLASSIFILHTYDEENLFATLLKNVNLSDFLSSLTYLNKIQSEIKRILATFKGDREELSREKEELEGLKEEQQELGALQEVEKRSLSQKETEKDKLLRLTHGKEEIFQQILKSKKRDIATLKTQLFYLEKTGITAEDAVKFAELAAKRVGIRPSFLLALLEVETGKQFEDGVISIGTNLGTGNWKTDLYDCYVRLKKPNTAEAEKQAFFKITEGLSLNPDKMPVSRRPNYGCGGAMGSAQFLPTTWLRFQSRVASFTGHNPPSPWNVEDAFTAAAIFLADAGASSQTESGEIRASKTYLSGSPNCKRSICLFYSNRILSLARDIDRIL